MSLPCGRCPEGLCYTVVSVVRACHHILGLEPCFQSHADMRFGLSRVYLLDRSDGEKALFVTERRPHTISIHEIRYSFKRVVAKCELEHEVSLHTMRATLATVLISNVAPRMAKPTTVGPTRRLAFR